MSELTAINYEPLMAMNNAWRKTIKASFHGTSAVISSFVLVGGVALLFYSGFGIYLIIGYFLFIGYRVQAYKNQVWQQFAVANGWPLDITTSTLLLIPPSLQFGHGEKFSPIIQAQLGSLPCDLFTYECTVGSGKNQYTYRFTLARMPIAKSLPHILLDSTKTHARLEQDLANHEHLHLEGDFDNYFKLEVEKGQEVDVLAVLTPDVMQTLVSYNQAEDVEILGNSLYFILTNDKRDYKDTKQLIQSVFELGSQIAENISLASVATPQPAQNSTRVPTPIIVPTAQV